MIYQKIRKGEKKKGEGRKKLRKKKKETKKKVKEKFMEDFSVNNMLEMQTGIAGKI